jgi:hypothetical protein
MRYLMSHGASWAGLGTRCGTIGNASPNGSNRAQGERERIGSTLGSSERLGSRQTLILSVDV